MTTFFSHPATLTLACLVSAYLLGSLSFAVIISRLMRLNDPRSYGSGNPGATNVLRSGNKVAALLTLLFDALKGFVPVLAVVLWAPTWGFTETGATWLEAGVGTAAFLGHLWPVFFRFQGGKGVATAAAVLVGLNPWLGLVTLLVWAAVAWLTRYVSLASMVAALSALMLQLLFWEAGPLALAIGLMSLLLVWRHEDNIQKLLQGTESKLGQKATAVDAQPVVVAAQSFKPRTVGRKKSRHPAKKHKTGASK